MGRHRGGRGCRTDRDEGGDGGEGDALDEGELHADEAADADRLDDGGDAAGEQVCVDEVNESFIVEPELFDNEERDDHGTRVEREDMLNTQNGEFSKGRNLIDGVGSGRGA